MFQLGFSTPSPGSSVNASFTVTGFLFDDGSTAGFPPDAQFSVNGVGVQFGANAPFVLAQEGPGTWSATGNLPAGTRPGQAVTVTIRATVLVLSNADPDLNTSVPLGGTLQVVAEQTPPQVVINPFDGNATVDQTPFRLAMLSGQALDSSGVSRVQFAIDNGPRHDVDSVTGDPSQVSWSKANIDFELGQHTITVFATDQLGNEGSATTTVTVRANLPAPPPPVSALSASPPQPVNLGFTPTFRHTNWVDNVDRIEAGGPNGFNVRFDAIDSDLRQASTVVGQINTALGQLGTAVTVTGQQRLTPGLDLVPLVLPGTNPWTYDANGVAHGAGGTGGGVAVMGLSLPEGITLVSFRAIGLYSGAPAELQISLVRSLLTDASQADQLATITPATPGFTNPFDLTVPVNTTFAQVDPGRYRYYVVASDALDANPAGTGLSTVQLVYTAS